MRECIKQKENWEKEQEQDRIRKTKKRANARLRTGLIKTEEQKQKSISNVSHQKKYAQRVKDRKCKSEVNDIVKESPKDYSTSTEEKGKSVKSKCILLH